MSYDLINIRHDEIGRVMEKVGCADRIERIMQLMHWAQMRLLESLAESDEVQRRALEHTAMQEIVDASERIGGYDLEAK